MKGIERYHFSATGNLLLSNRGVEYIQKDMK